MPYRRILISREQLERVVSHLAGRVHSTYQDVDNCLALVVLDGAKYFAEDLLAKMDLPFQVESIKASSYSGTNSTGTVTIHKKDGIREKVRGKNILLIDDIYDTGVTLSHILEWLNECEPATVKTCVLLEKKIEHTRKIDIDFLGTTIENVFAIGYGLDYEGHYRELPFIGELSEDIVKQHDPAAARAI
jgi:hypoxanthine phosphoribosyltransferase